MTVSPDARSYEYEDWFANDCETLKDLVDSIRESFTSSGFTFALGIEDNEYDGQYATLISVDPEGRQMTFLLALNNNIKCCGTVWWSPLTIDQIIERELDGVVIVYSTMMNTQHRKAKCSGNRRVQDYRRLVSVKDLKNTKGGPLFFQEVTATLKPLNLRRFFNRKQMSRKVI